MSDEDDDDYTERTIARVERRQFVLDGVRFSWWAINDKPALVTVSTQWFGNKVALTDKSPGELAVDLARQILAEHYARIEQNRSQRKTTDT